MAGPWLSVTSPAAPDSVGAGCQYPGTSGVGLAGLDPVARHGEKARVDSELAVCRVPSTVAAYIRAQTWISVRCSRVLAPEDRALAISWYRSPALRMLPAAPRSGE
jgi:hypothetical protein